MTEKIYRTCTRCGAKFEAAPARAGKTAIWESVCPQCGLNRQGFRDIAECRPGERVMMGVVYA